MFCVQTFRKAHLLSDAAAGSHPRNPHLLTAAVPPHSVYQQLLFPMRGAAGIMPEKSLPSRSLRVISSAPSSLNL